MANELYCKKCGAELNALEQQCPQCGTIQDTFKYKSRIAAAALAVFGGFFGAHRFFLGQWWGIFYLLLFWTYIPWIIGIIEGLVFLSTSQEEWNRKYNKGISFGAESGAVVIVFAGLIPLLAVVGILAAVAIPAYQDYTVRAKVTKGIGLAAAAKTAVSEYALKEQKWPLDNASAGLAQDISSAFVSSLTVDNGQIYVEVSPESGTSGALIFIPSYSDGVISWSCNESTVEPKYLPAKCR